MPRCGDLIIKENKNNGNTGAEECELFAEFYVSNYADPRKRTCSGSRSIRSDPATQGREMWALMTRADISDIIHLWRSTRQGCPTRSSSSKGSPAIVPGLHADYDDVTVTPNLTPAAYYTDNVFEEA